MKRIVVVCAVFGAGMLPASLALAAEPQLAPHSANGERGYIRGTMAAYFADPEKAPEVAEGEVKTEETEVTEEPAVSSDCGCAETSACCEPSCGCENGCGDGCGCSSSCGCCNDWCDLGLDKCWPFCCCCDYGDPCTLQGKLTPCCTDITYGGWVGIGYYTNNDPLSFANNDLTSFWDNPGELNADQIWLYTEKLAETGQCCWTCGYRFDLVYGVDAQKTQAFGNSGFPDPQGYDNSWDNGKYGWAMPQAYLQFAYDNWDIKVGHFFTPVGYEVIPKTGNFFYSHAYTMFNSEPFTHTGALASYKASEDVTYYMGWTLGWDTGFDQYGDGSSFLGGVALQLADDVKYTYMCTAGDLGWRGDGYSHSNVLDVTLSSKWQYVFQSDLLDTSETDDVADALSYGANNYLFYTINDCWKWGTRAEWWKSNQVTGDSTSFYSVATGLNYKASANMIVRPEVKFNWCPAEDTVEDATGGDFEKTLFGVDVIYTF